VLDAVAELGLQPQWEDLAPDEQQTSSLCHLVTPDGQRAPTAVGIGNGDRDTATLGAVCEALERFLTGPECFNPDGTRLRPVGDLSSKLEHEASAPLLARMNGEKLACWSYSELVSAERLDVPVYLSAPWYAEDNGRYLREQADDHSDYRALSRYAVNSGYALGATETEATLHALNETIERDACSLLLVRAFLMSGQQLNCLDPHSLPEELCSLREHVQERIGAPVHLLDATTDVNVPTVLAYTPPTFRRTHRYGAGTSLSLHRATYRALAEILETHLASQHLTKQDQPHTATETVARYPALRKCARFDLSDRLPHARRREFKETPAPHCPEQQLTQTLTILSTLGLSCYRRTVRRMLNGVTAVHVLIPGLERFFAIIRGTLILPGPRARAMLPIRSH
jgi:ribosomal protein S12 methylthiotransferase accessory factor